MGKGSSPVSFRISDSERALLEAVSYYMGDTLSDFIRRSAVTLAQTIVDRDTPEVVIGDYKQMLKRRQAREGTENHEVLDALERQLMRATGTRPIAGVSGRPQEQRD
jgi:uncharacterized protein (DUF1778 family)